MASPHAAVEWHSRVGRCKDKHYHNQPEGLPLLGTLGSIHHTPGYCGAVAETHKALTSLCDNFLHHVPGPLSVRQAVPARGGMQAGGVGAGYAPARGGGCQQRGHYAEPWVCQQRLALTHLAAAITLSD